jgi:glycosyltransferase involved in cell wall biosynthesis
MKKVLIITYYWPPAGGPGVQRITKFVKHLPEFGWQPIILTVMNPTSPAKDESLLKDIPKICKVYKTKALEPFNLYRIFTGKKKHENIAKDIIIKKPDEKISEKISRIIRANLFIPDARVGWIPLMVKEGKKIIRKENPRVIFSTSPPHSLQLGAKRLAKRSGLKWIADFRDPWTEAYWESEIERIHPISRLNEKLELEVLKRANTITTVSDGISNFLNAKMSNRYVTLFSGYEDINTQITQSENFNMVYLGNMSKYQSPDPILQAIKSLPAEIKPAIRLSFIGKISDMFQKRFEDLNDFQLTIEDYMPHSDMMRKARSASLLFLINPPVVYDEGLVTAKIFDYLSLRKPILAIGNKNGALEQILRETESGRVFNPDEIDQMSAYIKRIFTGWDKNKYILLRENKFLEKYNVKNNVQKLVDLFEN